MQGFILNRLQAALLNEAWRLVKEDYVTVDDLDKCLKDGLGLRWSFMGPFETIDLNAPGGVPDYAPRYGPVLYEMMKDVKIAPWDEALIAKVDSRAAQSDAAGAARRARSLARPAPDGADRPQAGDGSERSELLRFYIIPP